MVSLRELDCIPLPLRSPSQRPPPPPSLVPMFLTPNSVTCLRIPQPLQPEQRDLPPNPPAPPARTADPSTQPETSPFIPNIPNAQTLTMLGLTSRRAPRRSVAHPTSDEQNTRSWYKFTYTPDVKHKSPPCHYTLSQEGGCVYLILGVDQEGGLFCLIAKGIGCGGDSAGFS